MVSSLSSKKWTKASRQVVKSNLLVRFLEETSAWKNHFEFVWPLVCSTEWVESAPSNWNWVNVSAKNWAPASLVREIPWTQICSQNFWKYLFHFQVIARFINIMLLSSYLHNMGKWSGTFSWINYHLQNPIFLILRALIFYVIHSVCSLTLFCQYSDNN